MSGLRLGDIQRLPDVIDMVQPPPLYEEKDLEELRESIQLIIADFVATNVREYMFADFEERVAEHTRGPLMLLYEHAFETFKDINIDDFISEGIYIYTSLVGIPRSRETSDVAPRRSKREIGQRIKALRTTFGGTASRPARPGARWTARAARTSSSYPSASPSIRGSIRGLTSDQQHITGRNTRISLRPSTRCSIIPLSRSLDVFRTEKGRL